MLLPRIWDEDLFENMDKMDIQAERRNTKREKERADIAEQRAEEAEQQRGIAEQQRDEAIKEAQFWKKKVEELEKSKEVH